MLKSRNILYLEKKPTVFVIAAARYGNDKIITPFMHYIILYTLVPMYDASACARELFASPQTCFCILGHLHYHIMTRILYGLTSIAIILKSSLNLIYIYIYLYLCIYIYLCIYDTLHSIM